MIPLTAAASSGGRAAGLAAVAALALLSPRVGVPSEPAGRLYRGHQCPFDPSGMDQASFEREVAGEPKRMRQVVCAVDALGRGGASLAGVAFRTLADAYPCLSSELGAMANEAAPTRSEGGAVERPAESLGELVERLIPLLGSHAQSKKRCAAHLLGVVGAPEAVSALGDALADPDANVQRDVVGALREIRDPRTLAPLVRAARGPDPHIGVEAVAAVAGVGGPTARAALVKIVEDANLDRNVRLAASRELMLSGDSVAVAVAQRYLASLQPQWQRAFYLAGLLYVLAIVASLQNGHKSWQLAYYAVVGGSVLVLVNPLWLIAGEEAGAFWALAISYPLGYWVGGYLISWTLERSGRNYMAAAMRTRVLRGGALMWGTLVIWVVAFFVLMIVGLASSWR